MIYYCFRAGILCTFLLLSAFPIQAYPPEITGNMALGEKYFDVDVTQGIQEGMDHYYYYGGYIRYQQRLKPFSYYYFRYEYQKREYNIREQFTSNMHQFTANLTYQIHDAWRLYGQILARTRIYPFAQHNNYISLEPSFQANYYPTDTITCTFRYRLHRRWYDSDDKDYDNHRLTLSLRQRYSTSLTLEGGYSLVYQHHSALWTEGDMEQRLSFGFRLRIE